MIDDLPDVVLVEILCRLPGNKLVFQCKCVSKRWLSLISDPYFISCFVCRQRDAHKPIISTLVILGLQSKTNLYVSSNHPVFKTMKFIPFLEDQPKSIVVATYNDLVLYCSINHFHRDYHIYNPYTKQSVALPPTPGIYAEQFVGFICDPYYKYSGESDDREPYYKYSGELDDRDDRKEQTSTTTPRSIILNAEYRWMVVRIVSNPIGCPGFRVQIISSEIGEWREFVVPSSRKFCDFISYNQSPVAYKGMLYWLRSDGVAFVLDPFSTIQSGDNIAKYHFIEDPENLGGNFFYRYLGVCGGHLRMCVVTGTSDVGVWELKEEEVHVQPGDEVKFKWLAQRVSLPPKDIPVLSRTPIITVAAFYPNNQDVICLQLLPSSNIVVCKHREGTLEMVTEVPFDIAIFRAAYPFVIPFWPTPVPRLSSDSRLSTRRLLV